MTAKACGRMFQNSQRWLWKEPVSAAHNRGNNTPVGCGWKVDISPQHPWPKTKETGRLARPVPNGPRNGRLLQRAADGIEVRAELGTDTLHGSDDRNRDSGSNQAILDGRGS